MLKIEELILTKEHKTFIHIEELEINAGDKALIFGNNNSGKTYLTETIHGINTKYSGNILIKGKKIVLYKRKKKSLLIRNIPTYLPEDSLWKNMTLPLPSLTTRQKQRIYDFCEMFDMKRLIKQPVKQLSHSQIKAMEMIRGVIQLPYLLMLDDYDTYFDEVNRLQASKLLDFALSNGTAILATSNKPLEEFQTIYRLQNTDVVLL